MTVLVPFFTARMEQQIRAFDKNNVVSARLRTAWKQIGETFNGQVEAPSRPWPVIPAELGAGKTTCAQMYCAMLAEADHPGVLVVVPSIAQAKEFAKNVNEWSGTTTAFAFHSELPRPRPSADDLRQIPTLVICHKLYEIALDDLTFDDDERYDKVMGFQGDQRGLVIVDEAMDQVYIGHVSRAKLRDVIDMIPASIANAHDTALNVLESVRRVLQGSPVDTHHTLTAEALIAKTTLSVDDAYAAVSALWESIRHSHEIKPDAKNRAKEVLVAIGRHLRKSYRWIAGDKFSRTTAVMGGHLLLPPITERAGLVLLDATGRLNVIYNGRTEDFYMVDMERVRDYRNVTLYTATTTHVGKHAMKDHGPEIAQQALDAVLTHYGDRAHERRVLVVSHEGSEANVMWPWSRAGFKEVAHAHWNAIEGKNDWREFDTLVVLSVLNIPMADDMVTDHAIREIEPDDAALNAENPELRIMREARIAATLAQAIGRLRLRQMTHEDGTCAPCEVFVRLSRHDVQARATEILKLVGATLYGIRFLPWAGMSTEPMKTGRPAKVQVRLHDDLVALAKTLGPGQSKPVTPESMGTDKSALSRLLIEARTPETVLHQELVALGCHVKRGYGSKAGGTPSRLVRP